MFCLRPSIALLFFTVFHASALGQASSVYAWRTFTGQPGGTGNADGTGSRARFYHPSGAAVDGNGDLYVADTYNSTVRKVTKSGVVTTVAGTAGISGSADGSRDVARFSSPSSVAVDGAGNLYVTDTDNHTIRKVTSDGMVMTLAGGAGLVGSADGTNSAARFNEPYGIAVDGAGNLFVTDAGNSTLRKVTSSGIVTTLAGSAGQYGSADGTNTTARFYYPAGVAVDSTGNVFIADLNNSTIRKVTSTGTVTTLAGTAENLGSADGTNSSAQFFYPASVTVDNAGNVYVADTANSTIRRITSGGVVTTLAGVAEQLGSDDGTNGTARFNAPAGIAMDNDGSLFVADTDNSTIRKVTATGTVTTLAGSVEQPGSDDASGLAARFNTPYGVTIDGTGNTLIADTLNHTIRKVSRGGLVTTLAGDPGQAGNTDATGGGARFNTPYALVASGGSVFIADTFNQTIRKLSNDGSVMTFAGSAGQSGTTDGTNSAARFSFLIGIAADGAGNLYVADTFNHTIRKVTSTGNVTTLAGSAGQSGTADGTNGTARFNQPFGVATDAAGNVYVTDSASHTIRKVTSNGIVTTLAGSAGQSGSANGTNSVARFNAPTGIAVDGSNNIYVADIGSATIRKVTSTGAVTTLAGSAGLVGSTDGTGSAARFLAPSAIAIDSDGNLRVTDGGNHTLRKVTRDGVVTTLAGNAAQPGSVDVTADRARFFSPCAVTVGGGNLYVADTFNHTIRQVFSDGAVSTLAGLAEQSGSANGVGSSARFAYPAGIAADAAGTVYVADSNNSTVRKVTSDGVVTNLAGSAGHPGSTDGSGYAARFSYPSGIAVDSAGTVYVADSDSSTVRMIDSGGFVTTLAGSAGQPGSANGSGNAARFRNPNGVAVDSAGNLFVADSGNATVRKVTSDGTVTTLAGSAGQRGFADGTGDAARFDYPYGVTVDRVGNLFVTDAGNSTIRKITSAGVVTTIGGSADVIGGENGTGSVATFAGPCGIAVDGIGRLYIADTGNNRISRGLPLPQLTIVTSGASVAMSWPSPSAGFALQQSSDASGSNSWSISTYTLSDDGTNKSVTIAPPSANEFFRLIWNE